MAKITLIGAGSYVFTRNLCNDILLTPVLQDCTITLMDIDPVRLAQARDLVQFLISQRKLKAKVEATLDRRAAIAGADYVITTFQQGGLDAYQLDIDIPLKYGVGQCVGDTLGPGGVFRGLRTIPVLLSLCNEMDDLAPDALLLNYVNPMAANCWAVSAGSGRPFVGLCHSVQGTSGLLARWVKAPYAEVNFTCAGINHQSFFLKFRRGKEDLYPALWKAIEDPEIYGTEPVRIEMMKYFGYFMTESSGHTSEYVPYFRKTAAMIENELVPLFKNPIEHHWIDYSRTGGYLRYCQKTARNLAGEFEDVLAGAKSLPDKRSPEYGVVIIEAMETNWPARVNGNVSNSGNITNLPKGCTVEVPCLVDSAGIQPVVIGDLPVQLAALNRTNINVQELTVEAALSGKKDAVYQAVMMDPLTAGVCTLSQIHAMVSELLAAQKQWLTEFENL
jgi:alpha-galactosidase